MQQTIETLGALERRLDLTVPAGEIDQEIATRLKSLARKVRLPGFRPGKVPLKMISASHGAQVQAEVLNDKLGAAFNAAIGASNLRVAGQPKVEPKPGGEGGDLAFSATFEIYPEVRIGDLSTAQVQRATCPVGDAEVDQTIDIMRKQRATYETAERAAQDGDRLTVDFTGTLDGVAFEGGSGTDFSLALGEGRMLPEFEAAARGMSAGASKSFELTFPADYRAADLAGKRTQFEITVKRVEQPVLPALDAAFAMSLGVADGDLTKMRAEVRANLEREVQTRLKARAKDSVMNALLAAANFEVPKALVQADQQRLVEMARNDLMARGMQTQDAPIPAEIFASQAQRRVRLGLLLSELVQTEKLQARQDQVRKAIDEVAQSYERPAEVIQWYLGNRERLAEIETAVIEDNVVAWLLSRAKVQDVPVAFSELMGHNK